MTIKNKISLGNRFLSSVSKKKVMLANKLDLEGRPIKVVMMLDLIKKAYGRKFMSNIKNSMRKHVYDPTEFEILCEIYEAAKLRMREKSYDKAYHHAIK
jgi:hypothetical protein